MVQYRRNKILGGLYFFTVTIQNRKSRMLIEHIDILRNAIKSIKSKYPFKMQSFVILPDHIHAIWQLPDGDDNYSLRWQRIKGLFTHELPSKEIKLIKDKRGEYNLWQRRFWEHTIRDEKDLENHINYIHYNPVKHKLVKQVCDWPFSSFHYYVQKGLLPINWSSADDCIDEYGE